jgi:DNA modification methylase
LPRHRKEAIAMQIRDRIKDLRRVPAKSLRPSPKNWRTHPKAQQEALRGLLAEIGFADALLARELPDGTLELIDGHLRAETTPDMDVPVLVLDVNEEEAAKILLTLDPLAGMAEADDPKLQELLEQVTFKSEAVAEMLKSLGDINGILRDKDILVEDRVPEPLPVAVTRAGDLWLLPLASKSKKSHRLLCGDSTKACDVDGLMAGATAALVATDPPYLVDYTGERPKHGERDSGKDWSATYREVDIKDAKAFFMAVFENVLRVLAPKAAVYCWHAHRRCGMIQRVWEELGILDHQQIIWVKPASVFGRVYWHFRHEPCMMGWRKGSQPTHSGTSDDHKYNSVWELGWEVPGSEGATKARPGDNEHPTQKPVELFARPMRRHTKKGDLCFEPFSGSGTQIIAAEQLGRRCNALELEPVFVDVAIRRWQKLTGREAVLEGTGKTWACVAAQRGVDVDAAEASVAEAADGADTSEDDPDAAARG